MLALVNPKCISKVAAECAEKLNRLGTSKNIVLKWIKAHVNHAGNETADKAAKQGALSQPGVQLPIANTVLKTRTKDYIYSIWNKRWKSEQRFRQTKLWIPEIDKESKSRSKDMLAMPREVLGKCLQFITGFNRFRRHESLTDPNVDPTCRFCEEEEEEAWHLVSECPALWQQRRDVFKTYAPFSTTPTWYPRQIASFIGSLPVLSDED